MKKRLYPRLLVDLKKLEHNAECVLKECNRQGIRVAGVIKGCNGMTECAEVFARSGCTQIASSRLEQLNACRMAGISADMLLIRSPMLSEAEEAVRVADISLNSDIAVMKELNRQAALQNKIHKVILMKDLGDLREGFWEMEEFLEAALLAEHLEYLEFMGIGTNLGCYGAIEATVEKMEELVRCAEAVEAKIGRRLELISAGNTFSYPRVLEGDMPERINHIRIGEAMLLARDLQDLWGYDLSHMHQDVFRLQAEILEVRDKPTQPIGKVLYDAFGQQPEHEDRGIRRRALLGVGKVDYVYEDQLLPVDQDIQILGASSDHTILDVEDCKHRYQVGDIVEFQMFYGPMVYVTKSKEVNIVFV